MDVGNSVGGRLSRLEVTPDEFDFVELSVGEGNLPAEDVPLDLRSRLDERGFDLLVHLPFAQPVATAVPALTRANLSYLENLLGVAADAGARKAVVHATAREPTVTAQQETLRETLSRLSATGAENGVEVVVENVGQTRHGVSLSVLGELAVTADVSLCLDVAHAYLEGGQSALESFAEKRASRITHVHVHDARRRREESHIPVGSGEVALAGVAEALGDFDGTATVESFGEDPALLRHTADRFREAVGGD
jgi:sugar phosphate isomerase/epimerase